MPTLKELFIEELGRITGGAANSTIPDTKCPLGEGRCTTTLANGGEENGGAAPGVTTAMAGEEGGSTTLLNGEGLDKQFW